MKAAVSINYLRGLGLSSNYAYKLKFLSIYNWKEILFQFIYENGAQLEDGCIHQLYERFRII